MSSVPEYHRQFSASRLSRITTRTRDYASVGAQGGALAVVGQAFSDILGNVREEDRKDRELAQKAYLARLDLDLEKNLDVIQQEHQEDPEAFTLRANGLLKGLQNTVPPELADLYQVEVERKIYARQGAIQNKLLATQKRNSQRDLLVGFEAAEEQIYAARRAGDLEAAELAEGKAAIMADGLFSSGYWSVEDYADRRGKVHENIAKQTVLGVLDQELEVNGIEGAEDFFDSFETGDALPEIKNPDDRKIFADLIRDELDERYRRDAAEEAREDAAAGEWQEGNEASIDAAFASGQPPAKEDLIKLRQMRGISQSRFDHYLKFYNPKSEDIEDDYDLQVEASELARTDPAAAIELIDRGQKTGRLKSTTALRVRSDIRASSSIDSPEKLPVVQYYDDQLKASIVTTSPFDLPDPGESQRLVSARYELSSFLRTLPEDLPNRERDKAIHEFGRDLIRRSSTSAISQGALVKPRYIPVSNGPVSEADLTQAYAETLRRLSANQITSEVAQAEIRKIVDWGKALKREQQQAPVLSSENMKRIK